jgi:TonB family protein
MRPTLLESGRNFLESTECATASIVAHLGLVWAALAATSGGPQIPVDEREARVFFLLPPDRVDARSRQTEAIQWGRLGLDLLDGSQLTKASEGARIDPPTLGRRSRGDKGGARAQVPFGPVLPVVPDTVFSVLEVDEMVERHAGSAAPAYPRDLLAVGAEGLVQAQYVVDTTGRVDTSSVTVVQSDDPRFTASVLTALGQMRFRPARRGGRPVRQLVEQQFRFKILPATQPSNQVS